MLRSLAKSWAALVCRYAVVILLAAIVLTAISVKFAATIAISTRLEALMPEGAPSVQTLNDALRKTGSFASVQIVVQSDDPETTLQFVQDVKKAIDVHDWVESSQYSENVDVLEQHQLLLLDLDQLLDLERDVNEAFPNVIARELSNALGAVVTLNLRDENISGSSQTALNQERLDQFSSMVGGAPQSERLFVSADRLTAVLVVWPKPGLDSLSDAKRMVDDSQAVLASLNPASVTNNVRVGVGGRIANKVAQFDAIIADVKFGLVGAITLIALLITFAYRNLVAVPAIFLPLVIGIVWTIGLTAVTIGGLNLITIFLALILFGLGIDFGIHNFSRYREERWAGKGVTESIEIMIVSTGSASLIAALTTALGFYSLMLTEFRAFTEFGFIAGSGVLLIFVSMYSVFPALVLVLDRIGLMRMRPQGLRFLRMQPAGTGRRKDSRKIVLGGATALLVFSLIFVPQVEFERNVNNLEAAQPADLTWANDEVRKLFPDGTDRAIIVVETQEELQALHAYFDNLIATDTETPTIARISSLLDFLPNQESQQQRLEVIRRLERRADALSIFEPSKYSAIKRYLSINDLNLADLPEVIRRTYIGTDSEPGFLMYVYNSVSMDDSEVARQYYDDAAAVSLGDKQYFSASEGFIMVEMLALMKDDAAKAVLLVTLSTALLVFLFVRSIAGSVVVLLPPLLGVLVTVGIMGAIGLNLSIVNMVILPSLIGIAVDNSIHIFHRFKHDGADADIPTIMNNTGRAAVLTTLTTLLGFGGMVTASMGGLRSMGTLAIIGFLTCLIVTWTLLPVLLEFYGRRTGQFGGAHGTR